MMRRFAGIPNIIKVANKTTFVFSTTCKYGQLSTPVAPSSESYVSFILCKKLEKKSFYFR